MKTGRRWAIALGAAASAYTIYVGLMVHGSLAQLRIGRAPPSGAVVAKRVAPSPTESKVAAPRSQASAASGYRDTSPVLGSSSRAASPAAPATDPPASAAPDEDSARLRERALLDIATRPDFNELLNDGDPDVRKAVLDFFEER